MEGVRAERIPAATLPSEASSRARLPAVARCRGRGTRSRSSLFDTLVLRYCTVRQYRAVLWMAGRCRFRKSCRLSTCLDFFNYFYLLIVKVEDVILELQIYITMVISSWANRLDVAIYSHPESLGLRHVNPIK